MRRKKISLRVPISMHFSKSNSLSLSLSLSFFFFSSPDFPFLKLIIKFEKSCFRNTFTQATYPTPTPTPTAIATASTSAITPTPTPTTTTDSGGRRGPPCSGRMNIPRQFLRRFDSFWMSGSNDRFLILDAFLRPSNCVFPFRLLFCLTTTTAATAR